MTAVHYEDMRNKVALVTGAASGIGEACARQFAAQGCRLLLMDRDEERLHGLSQALGAIAAPGSVTDEATVSAAVDSCLRHFGGLDYAVNSAGVAGAPAAIAETTLDAWQEVININLTGVFLCLKHQLRVMQAAGFGAIVNIASGAGVIATPHGRCEDQCGAAGLDPDPHAGGIAATGAPTGKDDSGQYSLRSHGQRRGNCRCGFVAVQLAGKLCERAFTGSGWGYFVPLKRGRRDL